MDENLVACATTDTDETPVTSDMTAMDEKPVQCKFYNEGRCRFGDQCHNLHTGKVRVKKGSKHKPDVTKEPESKGDKLPSMKTARDVIQRIQWDIDMPSQYFVVGYLDRFVGVVEQPFDLFDWTSNLASVDSQNILAIPQHRIQYFKYRGKKVWDKNDRLDLIFGSTSTSTVNVKAFLRSIDEELLFHVDTLPAEPGKPDEYDPPTHFLAVRIDDAKLVAALDSVTTELSGSDTCVGRVDMPLYHCTLALLCLNSVEKIAHCTRILKNIDPKFFGEEQMLLKLEGLSTFQGRVLFSRVVMNYCLDSMVILLIDHMRQNEVCVLDRPNEFHVSLVKGRRNVCKFEKIGLNKFNEKVFGHQQVEFIHLCPLHEGPDVDGFYKVVTSVGVKKDTQV